jgi:UDP-N-acetylmuramoyl-L-alanyl-D-glutamate--2,6-diaminopimelate ligase
LILISVLQADVVAETASFSIWESEVVIRTPLGKLQVISPLLGKHNVYNILAAVATGIALKVPLTKIVAGIEAVEVVPGRCEIVDNGQDFSVIVDEADTPEALELMLSSLKGNAKSIFTILGARGEEDRSDRARLAQVAHALSDFVIFTNDSPRREDPSQIMQDLVSGLPDEIINKYSGYVYFPFQDQGNVPLWFEPYLQRAQRDCKRYVMEDRFSAIRSAIGTASPGDVVVIAGRGHKDYMEYWDGDSEDAGIVKGWFDDRVEARSALLKLSVLKQLDGKLDRKTLPWGDAIDRGN